MIDIIIACCGEGDMEQTLPNGDVFNNKFNPDTREPYSLVNAENPMYCGPTCKPGSGPDDKPTLGMRLFPNECTAEANCRILISELPTIEPFTVGGSNIQRFTVGSQNDQLVYGISSDVVVIPEGADIENRCLDVLSEIDCSRTLYENGVDAEPERGLLVPTASLSQQY